MKKPPEVNSLVVFNHEPDAAIFRVRTVEGRMIEVVDFELEGEKPVAGQWVDCSTALPLTNAQIQRLNS